MEESTIKNKVKELRTITVDEFLSLKFNTLKDKNRNVEKLKTAIVKNGFSFPIFIWQGNDYVIDGAGRKKAVKELKDEGKKFAGIPVVDIEAKTLEEAKQKTLEVSSQFGDITKDSFKEFAEDMKIDFDTFEIKGIDSDLFIEPDGLTDYFALPDGEKEGLQQITFTLADEQIEVVKDTIAEVKKQDYYKYTETFGNENSNGNALYALIREWEKLKI